MKRTGARLRAHGAHDWNRTNDLLLTKEVLYRLSYGGGDVRFTLRLLNVCYTNSPALRHASARWSGMRESNPRY
jgi:hypothetical protein